MPLTLSDIPLTICTDEIDAWVRKNIHQDDVWQFSPRQWPGFGLAGIAFRTDTARVKPVKPGLFVWPQGAARWAYGYYLCSTFGIDQIRNLAYGANDGKQMNALTLKMSTPELLSGGEQFQTQVYLLRAIPLFAIQPAVFDSQNPPTFVNGLYLIVVVDARYFWQFKSTPLITITSSTVWTDLLNQTATALGISLNIDSIDSRYLHPSKMLGLSFENAAIYMDALCSNIGHRFVRKLDGSCSTQTFSTAQSQRKADINAFPLRTIRAGGEIFVNQL